MLKLQWEEGNCIQETVEQKQGQQILQEEEWMLGKGGMFLIAVSDVVLLLNLYLPLVTFVCLSLLFRSI